MLNLNLKGESRKGPKTAYIFVCPRVQTISKSVRGKVQKKWLVEFDCQLLVRMSHICFSHLTLTIRPIFHELHSEYISFPFFIICSLISRVESVHFLLFRLAPSLSGLSLGSLQDPDGGAVILHVDFSNRPEQQSINRYINMSALACTCNQYCGSRPRGSCKQVNKWVQVTD